MEGETVLTVENPLRRRSRQQQQLQQQSTHRLHPHQNEKLGGDEKKHDAAGGGFGSSSFSAAGVGLGLGASSLRSNASAASTPNLPASPGSLSPEDNEEKQVAADVECDGAALLVEDDGGIDDDEPVDLAALERHLKRTHPRDKSGQPYPLCTPVGRYAGCCCACCCDDYPSSFTQYGPATAHYFKFVKLLFWILIYMGIVTIPQLLMNLSGSDSDEPLSPIALADIGLKDSTLGNLGLAANSSDVVVKFPWADTEKSLSRSDVSLLYALTDLLAVLFLCGGLFLLTHSERRENQADARASLSVDRYTVMVQKLPPGVSSDQIAHHFRVLSGEPVAEVVIAEDAEVALKAFQRYARAVDRLRHVEIRIRALQRASKSLAGADKSPAKSPPTTPVAETGASTGKFVLPAASGAASSSPVLSSSSKLGTAGVPSAGSGTSIELTPLRTPSQASSLPSSSSQASLSASAASGGTKTPGPTSKAAISRLTSRQKQLQQAVEKYRNAARAFPPHAGRTVGAFVTMATIAGAGHVLDAYPNGIWRWMCQSKRKRLLGSRIKVSPAPKPSTIIWQHLGYSYWSRKAREGVSLLFSSLLLLMTALFLYFVQELQKDAEKIGESSARTVDCGRIDESQVVNGTCLCAEVPADVALSSSDCAEWIRARITAILVGFAGAFVVLLVNLLLRRVVQGLGTFERHPTTDEQEMSLFKALLLRQFVNTAILVLLVNWDINAILHNLGVVSEDRSSPLAIGDFVPWDYTISWYDGVGTSLMLTVALSAFGVHFRPCCSFIFARRRQRRARATALTQAALVKAHTGPTFRVSSRLARIVSMLLVVCMFSPGMPLMVYLGALYMGVTFWIDKFLFVRYYATPPTYGRAVGAHAIRICFYSIPLHLLFTALMYSNSEILSSEDSGFDVQDSASSNVESLSSTLGRFTETHVLPATALLCLAVLLFLLSRIKCLVTRALHIVSCALFTASAQVRESDAMMYQSGQSALDSMTISEARASRYMVGLKSYYLADNPSYATALDLTPQDVALVKELGMTEFARRVLHENPRQSSRFSVQAASSTGSSRFERVAVLSAQESKVSRPPRQVESTPVGPK